MNLKFDFYNSRKTLEIDIRLQINGMVYGLGAFTDWSVTENGRLMEEEVGIVEQ